MSILDQTSVSAKQYIYYAFLELLGLQSFQKISVKDIVKKAGISRSTFYLHFQDKFDLLHTVREQLTSAFISFYGNPQQETVERASTLTTRHICQHIYNYRNFYQYEFEDPEAIQTLSNRLSEKLLQVYPDQAYAIFASYGTIGYLSFWVKEGFPISPQEAADKLLEIGITDWTQYISPFKRFLNEREG